MPGVTVNDTKIYEQVARKPGIRASEIAVNLDMTLATVSADLRSLVDAGDLVKRTEFGEQGRQCQVYELSEEFKASRTCKALMESLAPAAEPVPVKTGTTVDPVKPAAAPPAQQCSPAPTKVQLALDCITKLGSATDDQLRDAMGLLPKTYVGAYLTSAVKSGKVLRDGDRWKLGSGNTQAKALDSVEKVGNIIVATKDASPIPQAVVDAIAAAPLTLPAPATSSHRCAIWSDGTYELETDGVRVTILTHEQAVAFVSFIERMGAA